jgi:predicted amidohydrolase YtcJ
VDGSTQAGSAYLRESYIKPEWGVGFASYQQAVLNKAVLEAQHKGFQVGIHANGDAGIDMALKAYEHAHHKEKKKTNLRHRI